jgi:hypothetical protein
MTESAQDDISLPLCLSGVQTLKRVRKERGIGMAFISLTPELEAIVKEKSFSSNTKKATFSSKLAL